MRSRKTLFVLVFAAIFLLSSAAFGATRYVPSQYSTISAAYAAASAGDTILVANGMYTCNLDMSKRITLKSQNGYSYSTLNGNGSQLIENINGYGNGTVIEGFTITGGSGHTGGAIFLHNSGTITIRNCIFRYNSATSCGGAIGLNNSSSATITNCKFYNNSASSSGGAISISNVSSATISGCYFNGNTAYNAGAADVYNSSTAYISGSTFYKNSATRGGGAIQADNNGYLSVSNCSITFNKANNRDGGGLWIESDADISGCTIWGNTASYYGGGIYLDAFYKTQSVSNCTIRYNSARDGGGLYCDAGSNGTQTVTGCSIGNNTAGRNGGGIAVDVFYGNLTISYNNFYTNSPDAIYDPDNEATKTGNTF